MVLISKSALKQGSRLSNLFAINKEFYVKILIKSLKMQKKK